jgi:hypothetical protein
LPQGSVIAAFAEAMAAKGPASRRSQRSGAGTRDAELENAVTGRKTRAERLNFRTSNVKLDEMARFRSSKFRLLGFSATC